MSFKNSNSSNRGWLLLLQAQLWAVLIITGCITNNIPAGIDSINFRFNYLGIGGVGFRVNYLGIGDIGFKVNYLGIGRVDFKANCL